MNIRLDAGQTNIVIAALHELDVAWRKGTANAGFSERAIQLLRGNDGPWPHESEAARLRETLEAGHFRLELVPVVPVAQKMEDGGVFQITGPTTSCTKEYMGHHPILKALRATGIDREFVSQFHQAMRGEDADDMKLIVTETQGTRETVTNIQMVNTRTGEQVTG